MVESVHITNVITGQEISIDKSGTNIDNSTNEIKNNLFILDTVDWDAPVINFEKYKIPFQKGETLKSCDIGTRKPTIIGYVVANITDNILGKTWEQYYQEQLTQIDNTKELLNKVVNVLEDVTIVADGYKLLARPSSPPKYSINENENNKVLCMFSLEFECFDPMFYIEKYAIMQNTSTSTSVSVSNEGDIESDLEIKISLLQGGVALYNFGIKNNTTGELLQFASNLLLNPNDYLLIKTENGKEEVTWWDNSEGVFKNAIGYLTDNSKFFKLKKGTNVLAKIGTASYQKVEINFKDKFFGFKGM